ncbi:MAG TPA: PAS domain-containing protein [Elusimicrobiota bacterium]|nr:PAS domain-containing protein [Elusimicrobiota bacterium]
MTQEGQYYRSVLDNLGGGFLGVDETGRVAYGNATAGRILHIPAPVMMGKPYSQALEPYPALCAVIKDALDSGRVVRRAEVSIMHGDARMTIGYSTLRVRGPGGENWGVGVIFQDLTLALAG